MGLGFADRTDAFDLNVALQDHFKSLRLEEQIQKESEAPVEKLDLSLKEGQTIKASFFNIVEKTTKALKIEKATNLLSCHTSHLSKGPRNLGHETQEKTPFSDSVFHALSPKSLVLFRSLASKTLK